MKKIIAILVIFVCVGTALSAQINFSAGAGALFGGQFTAYSLGKDGKDVKGLEDSIKYENTRYVNFGLFGFFDATYVEADIGLRFGTAKQSSYPSSLDADYKKGTSMTFFTLGLFGKFPINLGGLTIFPLAGIEYDFLLAANDKNKDGGKITVDSKIREGANRFWVKFGAGGDINITRQIYIRPSFLYGFAFKNKGEKDELDKVNTGDKKNVRIFTHGFDLRVAAGYKF